MSVVAGTKRGSTVVYSRSFSQFISQSSSRVWAYFSDQMCVVLSHIYFNFMHHICLFFVVLIYFQYKVLSDDSSRYSNAFLTPQYLSSLKIQFHSFSISIPHGVYGLAVISRRTKVPRLKGIRYLIFTFSSNTSLSNIQTTSSSSSLPSILSACSFNGTERKCTEYSRYIDRYLAEHRNQKI